MFCSYCGKKIPDNSAFCAHCGSKITVYSDESTDLKPGSAPAAAPPVVQPTPQIPVAAAPGNSGPLLSNQEKEQAVKLAKQEALQNCFIAGWRKFITSPLVLITIIIQSISVFMNLAYIGNTIEAMEDMSDYLGDFAGSLFSLFSVGTIIINVLLTVGMWMIYANGQKKDKSLPSTKGLNLIIAFANIYYIGAVVLLAITGLICLGTADDISGLIIFIIMAAVAVSCAVIRWLVITILENTELSFIQGVPQTEKITGVGIFSIISGCITALSLVGQFESSEFIDLLPTLLGSTFSILIGCVMLSYKNTLEGIQYEQKKLQN